MKYLSSALMILLFCIPCQAMQHDPSTLEAILNPPKSHKPSPLSLQFMLNTPEPEDDQSDHSDLEVLPVNDGIPPINDIPVIHDRSKMTNEQGETGYECKHCGRMFPYANSRNLHERRCLKNDNRLTQNLPAAPRKMYQYAQKNADGTREHQCPYCLRTFPNSRVRSYHRMHHCPVARKLGIAKKKTIKCDDCDYMCFYQCELSRHKPTHTNAYQCPCSQAFKSFQTLRVHGDTCSQYKAIAQLMAAATLMNNNNNQRAHDMIDHNNNDHQMQQAE